MKSLYVGVHAFFMHAFSYLFHVYSHCFCSYACQLTCTAPFKTLPRKSYRLRAGRGGDGVNRQPSQGHRFHTFLLLLGEGRKQLQKLAPSTALSFPSQTADTQTTLMLCVAVSVLAWGAAASASWWRARYRHPAGDRTAASGRPATAEDSGTNTWAGLSTAAHPFPAWAWDTGAAPGYLATPTSSRGPSAETFGDRAATVAIGGRDARHGHSFFVLMRWMVTPEHLLAAWLLTKAWEFTPFPVDKIVWLVRVEFS